MSQAYKLFFLIVAVVLVVSNNAMAGFTYSGAPTCFTHAGVYKSDTTMSFSLDTDTTNDVHGMNFYLANRYFEHGAEFCPTHVLSYRENRNGNRSHPELELWRTGLWGSDKCFTVCEEGYFGANCEGSVASGATPKTCVNEDIELNTITDNTNKTGSSDPWYRIPSDMWKRTWWANCKNAADSPAHKDARHAVAWAIKRVLVDKNGVVVQPLAFWAYCKQSTTGNSCKVRVSPVGEVVIMCKNGYTVSNDKKSCRMISETACAASKICKGWDLFDDTDPQYKIHVDMTPGQECRQYRCAASGYGFAGDPTLGSAESKKCIECPTTHTQGVGNNGVCLVGGTGELYHAGEIVKATQSKMSDLKKCWDDDNFLTCLTGAI